MLFPTAVHYHISPTAPLLGVADRLRGQGGGGGEGDEEGGQDGGEGVWESTESLAVMSATVATAASNSGK